MAKLNDDNGYYKLRVTKTAAKKIKQLITKPRNQGKKNGIEGIPQEGGGGGGGSSSVNVYVQNGWLYIENVSN